MAIRVNTLLKNLTKSSNYSCQILEQKIKENEVRLSNYSEYKTINKEALIETINELSIKKETEKENIKNAISQQSDSLQINENEKKTIIVKLLTSSDYKSELQFNGNAQLPNGSWYQFIEKGNFYSFIFDLEIFKDVLRSGYVYKIIACIKRDSFPWINEKGSGKVHKRTFYYI